MLKSTPGLSEKTDKLTLCPKCKDPAGYMLRIPRSRWRRLFFLKKKHYLCQECGHKFYTHAPVLH